MDYFKLLPKVSHEGAPARNILVRATMIKSVIDNFKVFYPYEIKEWERPDTIAYDYYGNSDYEWLVCLPNQIYDMASDWPKDYRQFYAYMRECYGDVELTKNIINHYRYTGIGGETADEIARKSWTLTETTYNALPIEEKSGWTPVYLYDYEMELNEAKRKIKLISNVYLSQIDEEIKALFQ